MENNDDNAKEDFLLRSVSSNETTDVPSSNSNASKAIPNNKKDNSKDSKSSNKIIKNLIFLILLVVSIFYVSKSCNRDKKSYYDSALESFNSGNTESGFDNINEALEIDNQYAEALFLRAKQYIKIEEFQNAEYDLTELINLNEKDSKAYYLRGISYIGQATNKYSPAYKNAIIDFNKSIEIDPGADNSDSYYLRGDCKEITLGKFSGCSDFTEACDIGHEKGCDRYNDLCYPKTGFMPYEKYFGNGVQSGDNKLILDNTKSVNDALVIVQNIKTGIKIRCQFIRKGETLVMENIPIASYFIKEFHGNNWTFDEIMPDGVTRGGFNKNRELSRSIWNVRLGYNREMTLYEIEGGTLNTESINFEEFIK